MRYASYDLGHQPEGSVAVVHLRGSWANVILLDETNFNWYRRGLSFLSAAGGMSARTPIRLAIPSDGHWFVVVDLGGFRGRARGRVEVEPPPVANEARARGPEGASVSGP
jgi:Domain of unknown function (DUF1883)